MISLCAHCGAENPAGKKFCGECSAALGNRCPRCGADNATGKKFCGDCGAALVLAECEAQAAAPLGDGADLGRGEGYRYAHDEEGAVSDQPLLPDDLRGHRFYAPTDRGFERELGERLAALRKKLDSA